MNMLSQSVAMSANVVALIQRNAELEAKLRGNEDTVNVLKFEVSLFILSSIFIHCLLIQEVQRLTLQLREAVMNADIERKEAAKQTGWYYYLCFL